MPNPSAVCDAWYLVGPTASGKSEVALPLAQAINAEILSLDSMAVYRGMDIGTAKPDLAARRSVPHHLIDLVDPTDEFSVTMYLEAAGHCAADLLARGKQVLFVGGTPLYLKGLLRGLSGGPPADPDLRRRLLGEAEQLGTATLHQRLAGCDPRAAARIHPHDLRRIIRALEVMETTGQPISDHQRHFQSGRAAGDCRVFLIDWPRPQLHRRINQRVEAMFAAGFVDEVRALRGRYRQISPTAAQAVGYRQIAAYLDGQIDLPTAIRQTQAGSRQLARRQLIGYRGLSECRRCAVSDPLDGGRLVRQIVGQARPSGFPDHSEV